MSARPEIQPRVLKVAQAWAYAGFGNATDFYGYLKARIAPLFPQPIPPRQLPARPGDLEPRYAQPEYDRLDIDAWVEARKEPLRKADRVAADLRPCHTPGCTGTAEDSNYCIPCEDAAMANEENHHARKVAEDERVAGLEETVRTQAAQIAEQRADLTDLEAREANVGKYEDSILGLERKIAERDATLAAVLTLVRDRDRCGQLLFEKWRVGVRADGRHERAAHSVPGDKHLYVNPGVVPNFYCLNCCDDLVPWAALRGVMREYFLGLADALRAEIERVALGAPVTRDGAMGGGE